MNVGFTGHQNIGPERVVEWVRATISEQVERYRVTHGYTCLAAGADQLFAQVLEKKGLGFSAIIPCADYETTFDDSSDRDRYYALLSSAAESIQVGSGPPSEDAYYCAGREIVSRAQLVFAVWDGKKAKGLGGTADIVAFALDKGKAVIHINPNTSLIEEIKADSQRAREVIDAIS
jgi:hypothetical protein